MKSLVLGVAVAGLVAGVSFAQTPMTTPNTSSNPNTLPAISATPTSPTAGAAGNKDDKAAAGDNNQAVATTSANASQPAHGANSFTMGEAKSRIEKNGFTDVSDLKKDDNGVWRGSARKAGAATGVWLDYKGNTGIGS
jgi:hypothetical protein